MVGHNFKYSGDGRELVVNLFYEKLYIVSDIKRTYMHRQTHTEQHPYLTNFIYYVCRAHDETSTYAKPHMKR